RRQARTLQVLEQYRRRLVPSNPTPHSSQVTDPTGRREASKRAASDDSPVIAAGILFRTAGICKGNATLTNRSGRAHWAGRVPEVARGQASGGGAVLRGDSLHRRDQLVQVERLRDVAVCPDLLGP